MRLGDYPCALKEGTLAPQALRPQARCSSATATATSSTTPTASGCEAAARVLGRVAERVGSSR